MISARAVVSGVVWRCQAMVLETARTLVRHTMQGAAQLESFKLARISW